MTNFKWVFAFGVTLTLVACGGSKTQDKIDTANDDYRRMSAVEVELISMGVALSEPVRSATTIERMDVGSLERTRALLGEMFSRGGNILRTAQRKDVRADGDQLGRVERALREADRLRLKVLDVLGRRSGQTCTDEASMAVARQVALVHVGGLSPRVNREVDLDRVSVSKLDEGCNQFKVTFRGRSPECRLRVIIDRNTVIQDRSDQTFSCR